MGIQINGSTDTISAVDGSLSLEGGELRTVSGLNVSGVATATTFIGNLTGSVYAGIVTATSNVVVAAGTTDAPSINPSGDSNTGIFFPSADTIAFGEGGSEAARIDSSGRVLVGMSSVPSNKTTVTPTLAVSGSGVNGAAQIVRHTTVGGGGALLELSATRGTSATDYTILQSGDGIGTVDFLGADGNEYVSAATISAQVDGTPGDNDMPGRLVFSTTADGASSPTERMRIQSNGKVGISIVPSNWSAHEAQLGVFQGTLSSSNSLCHVATNNSADTSVFHYFASSNYTSSRDTEFYVRNDGFVAADGSFSGGGADYAEYFEWDDGNLTDEDRRGLSVVLTNGNKIRVATSSDASSMIIGVISATPAVVGDSDLVDRWKGKYLKDDFGTYLVAEDGGRVLNPDYDPDQEYVVREDRPEWDYVGLMGKLRIKKGQPTGDRWIKMRDISDNVEEWLVR